MCLFLCLCNFYVATGFREENKFEHKPVAASFALQSTIHTEQTVDRVTIGSPRDSEGAGSQQSLHSPTTGQLKTVSLTGALPPGALQFCSFLLFMSAVDIMKQWRWHYMYTQLFQMTALLLEQIGRLLSHASIQH